MPRVIRRLLPVLLLSMVLGAASSSGAELPVDSKPVEAQPVGAARFLIPSAEVVGLYAGLASFNRYVLEKDWAYISPDTVHRNLTARWVLDQDDFTVNQIGHPYQGSLYFTAARSSGLSFWQSLPYVLGGSVLWEVAGESEPPSLNDQVTTTFAGTLLGEALFRSWYGLIGPEGESVGVLRYALATIVAPMATLNRLVFDGGSLRITPRTQFFRMWLGSNYAGQVKDSAGERTELLGFGRQVSIGVTMTHGFPGPQESAPYEPFDHFDLKLEAAFPNTPYIGVFTRGLVWGGAFEGSDWLHGLWGLFGSYDFSSLPLLRVSSSAVGPGVALRFGFAEGVTLQTTAVLSGVFFGSAGSVTEPVGNRDYHVGGGAQSLVEARLLLRDAGTLSVGSRNYLIRGYASAPGTEFISYGWIGSELRVIGHHAVGVEIQLARRAAQHPGVGELSHTGSLFRVYYAFVSDPFFGAGPARASGGPSPAQ